METTVSATNNLEQKPKDFLIVGLGASAGGIQALKDFFEHVPEDSGMAYVVILHLSPDHDSKLAEVLQVSATIPTEQVIAKTEIKPDHIYVIPPNRHLVLEDGHIAPMPTLLMEERVAPVDIFFRHLADTHTSRAVCVVLSGTGANGSMGLKRVKEKGGAVFVQSPRQADFNEMPRNAIATDLVDEILPVEKIPERIISYRKTLGIVQIPLEPTNRDEEQQHALREVFLQLRLRTGHDFTNYKRPTLIRRIERRINIRSLNTLQEYTTFLKDSPDEVNFLLKDLLISVTNFFRDRKAFDAIEQDIIPRIVQDKTSQDQVRIWAAGCATGEEAYTLAMLCAEKLLGVIDAPKIQVFATDIDTDAIAHAREGLYTINDAADVSPERLRRFFTKEGDAYRIRREIREMILFANHNFLKDPPFSHLDLVSCRNVMIYLNNVAQERAVETFHFALNPGSFLFLGTSESVDGASDLYAPFNREQHIYQSRQVGLHSYPVPDSVPTFRIEPGPTNPTQEHEKKALERITFGDLHQRLLEEYASPSLVVNEEYDIIHLSGRAGKFLQIGGGELSQNLLKLVKEELRLEVRSALYQAVQRQVAVEARALKVSVDDHTETINIHIRPVLRHDDTARGYILVIFEPAVDSRDEQEVVLSSAEPISRQLEEELNRLKSQLRTSIEQHEFQAEELKASNEELQAMNEELRSAAEELETSKEELQSINEELRTVNQELKIKIEETTLNSNNLQNLINSTDIATVFLDRSFRVVLFTPSARQLFNLIPTDYGRPLSDITSRLDYPGLLEDAEAVLMHLSPVEREITTAGDQIYLMRMMPYRTSEDRINGVVLSFINITDRKQTEQRLYEAEKKYSLQLEQKVEERTAELKEQRDLIQATMDSTMEMIQVFKAVRNNRGEIVDFEWILNNHASEKSFGNVIGKRLVENNPGVVKEGIFDTFKQVLESGVSSHHERHYVHEQFDGWFYQSVVKLDDGVVTTTSDITNRKKAEQQILDLKDELVKKATDKYLTLFNAIDEAVIWCEIITDENGRAVDYRMLELNPAFERMTGITVEAAKGRTGKETIPGLENWWIETYGRVALDGETVRFENKVAELDRWFDFYASPIGKREEGQFVVVYKDVSTRKRQELQQAKTEEALRQNEERIRTLSNAVPQIIWTNDENGVANFFNQRWFEYSGLSLEESMGRGWEAIVHPDDQPASKNKWQKALAAGEIFDTEYRLRRYDGVYRWFIGRNIPLKDPSGNITGWFGSATDIEDLKRSDEALRSTTKRLQLALDAGKLGSFEFDFNTGEIIATAQHKANFGFNEDEPISFSELKARILAEDREHMEKELANAVANREVYLDEYRVQLPGGDIRWIRSVGHIVFNKNEEPQTMAGITLDTTAQKSFTEELTRKVTERTLELQRSNENLQQFATIASHDLQEPLRKLKLFSSVLQRFKEQLPVEAKELLSKIHVTSDRMSRLISEVLQYSKIAYRANEFVRTDLNEVMESVVRDLEMKIAEVKATVQFEHNLPSIEAVPAQMNQLFCNLLTNSLKFKRNGVNPVIVISSSTLSTLQLKEYEELNPKKLYVRISFSDNGIGFDNKFSEQIFQIFERLHSLEDFEGTGVGLALCKKIVENHSGHISAEGRLNEGTTFLIILPVNH